MWSLELELELGEGHVRTRSLLESVEFGAWLFPFFLTSFQGNQGAVVYEMGFGVCRVRVGVFRCVD